MVDKSGRDVSRYRFMSFNADPFIKEDADTYDKFIEPKKAERKDYAGTDRGVQLLYDAIMASGTNITERYSDWLSLACSLRDVPNGRQMFHDLSTMDARYNSDQCNEQFDAILRGKGYSIATFFWLAKQNGITVR